MNLPEARRIVFDLAMDNAVDVAMACDSDALREEVARQSEALEIVEKFSIPKIEIVIEPVLSENKLHTVGYRLEMNLGGLKWTHRKVNGYSDTCPYKFGPNDDDKTEADMAIQYGALALDQLKVNVCDIFEVVAVDSRVKAKYERLEELGRERARLEAELGLTPETVRDTSELASTNANPTKEY